MDELGEIYLITNQINGKRYIGQAHCHIGKKKVKHGTEGRWMYHLRDASLKTSTSILHRAINKYGKHNFQVKTIFICKSSQLDYYENKYIRQYNSLSPHGYNLRMGGSHGKYSEEAKRNISNAISGEKHRLYNKHQPESTRRKISEAMMGSGNHRYGVICTPEYREKMSELKRSDTWRHLPMYVYYDKCRKHEGFTVRRHPKMGNKRKVFVSSKLSMEEKLELAVKYLESLS